MNHTKTETHVKLSPDGRLTTRDENEYTAEHKKVQYRKKVNKNIHW